MVDFHSHILPAMDDGCRNIQESLTLLKMQAAQGVQTTIATPHFYATDESVEKFLTRRKASAEKLSEILSDDLPRVLLGAEVRYYQGISRLENLSDLCIEGTNLILLEMPVSKWTDYNIREILELSGRGDLTLILAHIERYMGYQSRSKWKTLEQSGILMQVNASFFNSLSHRRKSLRMLGEQRIQLIGSDCHDPIHRNVQLGKTYKLIDKKYGSSFVKELITFENSLLSIKADARF